MALHVELALRRTADRVDEQMRAWRGRPGEEKVWRTATRSFMHRA